MMLDQQVSRWIEQIAAEDIDFDQHRDLLLSTLEVIGCRWSGAVASGVENANGIAYGWLNLAMDPKIQRSIAQPLRPQLSRKIISKTRARGHSPTILGLRFSLQVPAAYWSWFRFEAASSSEPDLAGAARSERERAWLEHVLSCADAWHFLQAEQLTRPSPAELGGEPLVGLLFPMSY